jgi:hypothetical protein
LTQHSHGDNDKNSVDLFIVDFIFDKTLFLASNPELTQWFRRRYRTNQNGYRTVKSGDINKL